MLKIVPYDSLPDCDLVVDAIYEGGSFGNRRDDPISRVLAGFGNHKGVGNQGGFRAAGVGEKKKLVVLYTDGENSDWPDSIDNQRGIFTYFGDNRKPGHELHDTRPGGNKVLRNAFDVAQVLRSPTSQFPLAPVNRPQEPS